MISAYGTTFEIPCHRTTNFSFLLLIVGDRAVNLLGREQVPGGLMLANVYYGGLNN